MPLCANCSQLKGLALFPSLSPDICISIEFAFVHKSHVCVKRWIWMLQMTPLHVLTLVVVCVFIHVCMSTREHWGAFRLQTPPSPHRAVWSCWNSESEPAASTHISSATWPKKQDQHLWFFFFFTWCQLDDSMLTLPCPHQVNEMKPVYLPRYIHSLLQTDLKGSSFLLNTKKYKLGSSWSRTKKPKGGNCLSLTLFHHQWICRSANCLASYLGPTM